MGADSTSDMISVATKLSLKCYQGTQLFVSLESNLGSSEAVMLKNLLLIRHAKAAAFGDEPGDHGRALCQKGMDQLDRLSEQLSAANILIDRALVSSAVRTCQTWDGLAANGINGTAHIIEELYLASAEQIEQQIWLHGQEAETVAVIGHNPGIAVLAWKLLEKGSTDDLVAGDRLRTSFKTAFAAYFAMGQEKPKLLKLLDPRL